MPEVEPKVQTEVVHYLKISYGSETIVMPREEGEDLIRQIAKNLPDDDATSK